MPPPLFQMGDGSRILRLTRFTTLNGPDVHVYMVASYDDAKDAATVQQAGFIDLGVLKGNIGDQNYGLALATWTWRNTRGVHLVQTIQRELRSRGATTGPGAAKRVKLADGNATLCGNH